MSGLKMKYFVLKPEHTKGGDPGYACASRKAMRTYAKIIRSTNPELANGLIRWVEGIEAAEQKVIFAGQ